MKDHEHGAKDLAESAEGANIGSPEEHSGLLADIHRRAKENRRLAAGIMGGGSTQDIVRQAKPFDLPSREFDADAFGLIAMHPADEQGGHESDSCWGEPPCGRCYDCGGES